MNAPIAICCAETGTRLELSDFSTTPDGFERLRASVRGQDFFGTTELSYHPGEVSLIEFFRSIEDRPLVYSSDRWFSGRTVNGISVCLGKHGATHVSLFLDMAHTRCSLILPRAELLEVANQLSMRFHYEVG